MKSATVSSIFYVFDIPHSIEGYIPHFIEGYLIQVPSCMLTDTYLYDIFNVISEYDMTHHERSGQIVNDISYLEPSQETKERVKRMNNRDARKRAEREEQSKSVKSPLGRFYQISEKYNKLLVDMGTHYPKALSLLLFIFEKMDRYNAVVMSYNVITERLKISRATAERAVKYLKDNGFIYIKKSGTTNIYIANSELAWKSYGKNIVHCEFPANVVLTSSDQDDKEDIIKTHFTKMLTLDDSEYQGEDDEE